MMAARSKIEWTNSSWGAVLGCTKVSPGCASARGGSVMTRLGCGDGKPSGLPVLNR
jgi:protein gp37